MSQMNPWRPMEGTRSVPANQRPATQRPLSATLTTALGRSRFAGLVQNALLRYVTLDMALFSTADDCNTLVRYGVVPVRKAAG